MTRPSLPAPLPIQVRPVAGESAEYYLRRLARANHMRPSYLRHYLARPPESYGPIDSQRLAAAAGRSIPALQYALPDLARQRHPRHMRCEDLDAKRRNQERKQAVFTAIRRDARRGGCSIRELASRHRVHRRTVRQALTRATPPERKKRTQAPTVHGLHPQIDAMIEADPAITAAKVWTHLVDEHDATISYGATRHYVTRRKSDRQTGQIG